MFPFTSQQCSDYSKEVRSRVSIPLKHNLESDMHIQYFCSAKQQK